MTVTPKMLSKGLIGAPRFAEHINYASIQSLVELTPTTALLAYMYGSSGPIYFRVLTIDPKTHHITLTDPFKLPYNVSYFTKESLVRLTDTTALFGFADPANGVKGTCILVTVSGTGKDATVSFGDKYVFYASAGIYQQGVSMAALSSTQVLMCFQLGNAGPQLAIVANIAADSTITFGTYATNAISFGGAAATNNPGAITCVALSPTTAIMAVAYGTVAPYAQAALLTISGSSISIGAVSSIAAGQTSAIARIVACKVDSTKAMIITDVASGHMIGATVSGTTLTIATNVLEVGPLSDPALVSMGDGYAILAYNLGGNAKITLLSMSTYPFQRVTPQTMFPITQAISAAHLCAFSSGLAILVGYTGGYNPLLVLTPKEDSSVGLFQLPAPIIASEIARGAIGGHTEVSSIFIGNSSAMVVTLYLDGFDSEDKLLSQNYADVYAPPLLLPNSPIILEEGQSLIATYPFKTYYAAVCSATVFGIEEV